MIIGNVNSYAKNPYMNNSNYKQLQKVLNSNNKIANINKKEANQTPKDLIRQKVMIMNTQLTVIQNSEQQIQSGMTILQKKESGLDNINDVGNQLKELATQYKKSDLSENDKLEIEKKTGELVKNLGNLINKNDIVGDKIIKMNGSDGETSIILSKGIDITLDFGKLDEVKLNNKNKADDDKHFFSNVSVKTLLENHSIIEERILKPVQKVIEKVNDEKSIVYNKFIKEYASATNSIDELFKIGGISAYAKDVKMLQQKSMYIAVSELYSHSSNMNKDNVS
ncbi:hypothetical protein G9F71_026035 [Clostridium sp. FP2]|uniref:hypothetical protein n=1 Tax=Clostridium sp. FP2 TaxID=2724481 RepID=UPI0013E928B7|nr:hypothetical protein [Clostridium sp. FP2]MBZ9626269.1 hypothetical protein [Clostridium sp. FP2]